MTKENRPSVRTLSGRLSTFSSGLIVLFRSVSAIEVTASDARSANPTDAEKVIKTTVFIKNMDDFSKVNEIYSKYFTKDCPARSCVEVARLPKDVLIEIEAIAEK